MVSRRVAFWLGSFSCQFIWSFVGSPVRAAWCWTTNPPRCGAIAKDGRSCAEGDRIVAGTKCTSKCDNGKVPCGAGITCPASANDGAQCLGDAGSNVWWNTCGPGASCVDDADLWTAGTGSFACEAQCAEALSTSITPAAATTPMVQVVIDPTAHWDAAVFGMVGATVFVALLGAVMARLPASSFGLFMHTKRSDLGSIANIAGFMCVFVAMVVVLIVMVQGMNEVVRLFGYGLAAGLMTSLPVWWASFGPGVHLLVGISREAAWRVHAIFGYLSLIFGTIHGIHAAVGPANPPDILSNPWWTLGFVGLLLMWMGYFPVPLAIIGVLHYDRFKVLHFASGFGYLCAIIHMLDHAMKLKTTRSWTVLMVNLAALANYLLQKLFILITGKKATIQFASVEREAGGAAHIFLQLEDSGFKPLPGQWAHLQLAPPVAHPFTIVPGSSQDSLQFFIKVQGQFTQSLARKIEGGDLKRGSTIGLQGPYGSPPAFVQEAAIFVLGGVGVTPALSLVAEAVRKCGGDKVKLFWVCRSPSLLKHCLPILEADGLQDKNSCICLTSGDSDGAVSSSFSLLRGRSNVREWLAQADSDFGDIGVKNLLLFASGPEPLIVDTRTFVLGGKSVPTWNFHAEEFRFLPSKGNYKQRSASAAPVQVLGQPRQ